MHVRSISTPQCRLHRNARAQHAHIEKEQAQAHAANADRNQVTAETLAAAEEGSKAAVRRLQQAQAAMHAASAKVHNHAEALSEKKERAQRDFEASLQAVYAEMRSKVELYR